MNCVLNEQLLRPLNSFGSRSTLSILHKAFKLTILRPCSSLCRRLKLRRDFTFSWSLYSDVYHLRISVIDGRRIVLTSL